MKSCRPLPMVSRLAQTAARWTALLACASGLAHLSAATLSDARVDAYNVRVGTQTFSPAYHFTTATRLVETANAIRDMGSDAIKLIIGRGFAGQYSITLGSSITNLVTLVRNEPSCRQVFDMPFRHYVLWTYAFSTSVPDWNNGYTSATDRANDYREFYDLTRYLLTNYDNSGKSFYLGHWEGDGYLTGNNFSTNPTPTMVQGFINYLNNRQKAIDDAKQATAFTNVNVFGYSEANRVRDAINNNPNSNVRMINAVIPYVTNLDYVSYSAYDMQRLDNTTKTATLDYMEAHVPTNKASVIMGERIWIGEYGYANAGDSPAQQEPETRAYIQFLLNYGVKGIPYILFWEIYDNETNPDGSFKYFYLIDPTNSKAPCYYLHQRFLNNARLLVAQFNERNGRLPTDAEFVALVTPMLNQPLPAPINLAVDNSGATVLASTSASLSGTLAQGVYGDECSSVWVYYGRQDGGTARAAWEHAQQIGLNTNFNPTTFTATLSGLPPNTNFYYRFYATNSSGESWAPGSGQFNNQSLNPSDYACRLKIAFSGYNRGERLVNFPAQVNLGPVLPGFSYQQFASPAGGDLRFTDAGGYLLLPYEIDEWNTNGTSIAWVRVPQLTGTNDYIWAFWGNPAASTPPPSSLNGSVWANDHEIVYHLRESGFPYNDSTEQNPALSGVAPLRVPGIIDHGAQFDGASQYLSSGVVSLPNAVTLSAWVNVAPGATNIQTIWANKPGGWNSPGFALYINSYNTGDGELRLETGDGTSGVTAATAPGAVSFGAWHRIAAVIDRAGGTGRLVIDGVDRTQSSTVQSTFANHTGINLGRFTNSSLYFKGSMDEARIESATRSTNWLWASWLTTAGNSSFISYSGVNPQPIVSMLSTANGPLLSWPADAGPFTLFTSTNLLAPGSWVPATNAPVLANGQYQVPLGSGMARGQFFRLQQ